MSTPSLIQVGDRIKERYYAVPEGEYFGPKYDTFDEALDRAKERRVEVIDMLFEKFSGWFTDREIEAMADAVVRIELRLYVENAAGAQDVVVETYRNVNTLQYTTRKDT